MVARIRLVICHQNRLFRECLVSALAESDRVEVSDLEKPETDVFQRSRKGAPDLLLIDAGLPDMGALRLVRSLRESNCGTRTILLVSSVLPDLIESCLQAGAEGCVLDDDSLDDLRQAIEHVLAGRTYCSPQVAHRLFTQLGRLAHQSDWSTRLQGCQLTRRELDILRLIAHRNLSNKEIARELHLSVYTVKNHVHSLIEKLGVEDRQTAVRDAVRQGILREPGS
jgi:DNA-binding NarL/FixJ family response regulator